VRSALAILVTLLCAHSAHADGKRRIAVFEYRQGSRGAPEVGLRLAAELARSTTYEVVDPTEARRILGPSFDADVARCAGAPSCVAQLATRLEAEEALLIGVSQLGDLVLALQRVDAKKGQAISRLAESLPADKAPDAADLADWLHQLFPADTFRRYGAIRIVADLDDAQVSINGQPKGMTPLEHALKVAAPGSYRVRVDKPGFLPFQARIEVPPDATVEVRATLSRRVGPTPWYKRWYVWATIGGALAAAGAGVAIYYGTRVDETPHGYVVPPH
jgi:hypothetical protein